MYKPNPAKCPFAESRPDRFDEPGGIICALSGGWDGCGAEDGDCPRLLPAGLCPKCFEEGHVVSLIFDSHLDFFFCKEYDHFFWPDQVQEQWREIEGNFSKFKQKVLESQDD